MPLRLPPAPRQDSLRLSDGRRLAWREWGPRDGAPALFCTGAGMSGALGLDADILIDARVRLLAVDRPGLGASDPHAQKTLSSWAHDIGELMAARELANPVTIGFSQGAPFALALADARLVHAAALVSGQDDLNHPTIRPQLHPAVAGMVEAANADPTGFEQRIAEGASAEWLWNLILDMSADCDRAIYAAAPFVDRYRMSLEEGFMQGSRGYARDLAVTFGRWPFAPESVSVPVDLWYGGLDTSPVHSPDFGATLATRLPAASITVDDAAGGTVLWTRTADILGALNAHASK